MYITSVIYSPRWSRIRFPLQLIGSLASLCLRRVTLLGLVSRGWRHIHALSQTNHSTSSDHRLEPPSACTSTPSCYPRQLMVVICSCVCSICMILSTFDWNILKLLVVARNLIEWTYWLLIWKPRATTYFVVRLGLLSVNRRGIRVAYYYVLNLNTP